MNRIDISPRRAAHCPSRSADGTGLSPRFERCALRTIGRPPVSLGILRTGIETERARNECTHKGEHSSGNEQEPLPNMPSSENHEPSDSQSKHAVVKDRARIRGRGRSSFPQVQYSRPQQVGRSPTPGLSAPVPRWATEKGGLSRTAPLSARPSPTGQTRRRARVLTWRRHKDHDPIWGP